MMHPVIPRMQESVPHHSSPDAGPHSLLLFVVSIGFDNEPVICMDVPRWCKSRPIHCCLIALPRRIARMMTRSDTIDIASPRASHECVTVVLGARRKGYVHQMRD